MSVEVGGVMIVWYKGRGRERELRNGFLSLVVRVDLWYVVFLERVLL